MNHLLAEAKALQDQIVRDRRYLHQNAERGHDLPATTAYVSERLKAMGYEPKEMTPSGIVALAGGKKPGKTFLIRADMDALPIAEETGLEFRSKTQYMHACGHDTHAAMLLGAAKLLKGHEDEIRGAVKLMFQPAEELLAGAKTMIEAGILDNPKVDAAAMIHSFTGIGASHGLLVIPAGGYVTSSGDVFRIEINGKGGHGAMPHTSVDPLNVAAHIHIGLQEIIAREMDPSSTAIITVGIMQGGQAENIIPDSALLSGTIRSFNADERSFMKKRIAEIAKGVGTAYRATVNVTFPLEAPSVYNDPALYRRVLEINREMLGEERIKGLEIIYPGGKMTGCEDFSYVSERVPSVMMILTAGSPEKGYSYPLHHPKADFDESVLHLGAAVYANTALEWLKL